MGCRYRPKGSERFALVLNSKCAAEIEWHCKHYASRGLMKKCLSGAELAKFIDVSPATLEKTFKQYNEAARNNNCPSRDSSSSRLLLCCWL